MKLEGKRVLITGGNSGIGRKLVEQFVREDAHVVFTGLEQDAVLSTCHALSVEGISADLSLQEGIDTVFEWAMNRLGGIDILINNAGGPIAKPIEALSRQDFEYMYALNAIAPAMLIQKSLPYFYKNGMGDVVNVGATGGHYGFPTGAAYGSSKAALYHISTTLVKELRTKNIRITHVDPSRCYDTSEGPFDPQKLNAENVSELILSTLNMSRNAFVPQVSVWATNP